MKLKSHKGFTLIELLVVVAIIGILASVVLAALGSARGKASAAKAKSEMSQMRAQAEIYYLSNGDYGAVTTACSAEMFQTGTDNLDKLMESVLDFDGNLQCESTGTTWAVYSPGMSWCVDSSGNSDDSSGQSGGVCTLIP